MEEGQEIKNTENSRMEKGGRKIDGRKASIYSYAFRKEKKKRKNR